MERKISATCYLDYVNLGDFNIEEFRNPMDRDAKDYNDPDACCNELYMDLLDVYRDRFLNIGFTLTKEENEFMLWMDSDQSCHTYTMSSDFIGPSRAWAKAVGVDNKDVGKYLKKTRIIGGHMLWPVQYYTENRTKILLTGRGGTINTCRGGNKGFCDRIDCTLYDLKRFYDYHKGYNVEYKLSAFDKYKNWLMLFKSFKGFIDFFFLDAFCDSEYRVYDLKSYDINKKLYQSFITDDYTDIGYFKINDKKEYCHFIEGNTRAIELRQISIKSALGK